MAKIRFPYSLINKKFSLLEVSYRETSRTRFILILRVAYELIPFLVVPLLSHVRFSPIRYLLESEAIREDMGTIFTKNHWENLKQSAIV